jgi:hypothetical protein
MRVLAGSHFPATYLGQTLVGHWRKPLPSERGEPADAGESKSFEGHPLRVRVALCATSFQVAY